MGKSVVYVTDPEGNLAYFARCITQSNGAYLEDGELLLRKGWLFVFGGDLCDKADGSLRIAQMIIAAKRRYPDRVFIIAGNRDLNKLRLRTELSDGAMASEPAVPYGAPKSTLAYAAFLAKLAAEAKLHAPDDGPLPAALYARFNTKPNRLRWILDHTMGAAGDFERRRDELRLTRRVERVGDDDVVASFVESVADTGVLTEVLKAAHLAVGIDETLYVHGGLVSVAYAKNAVKFVTDSPHSYGGAAVEDGGFEVALGFVPGHAERIGDVRVWTEKLNKWLAAAVAGSLAPPGAALDVNAVIAQQYATYGTWPSVIIGRHLNDRSQPVPLPPSVSRALLASGFTRLVIGHTPHGNCPTVVPGAVQLIMADTSYSDMKAPDNRGNAAATIEIQGTRASVVGQLEDGTPIAYTVFSGDDASRAELEQNDVLIGGGDFGGWFVKAKLALAGASTEPSYLLCRVDGFKYEYKRMGESEARRELKL
ncbi:hypothetical protein KFE25_005168 [Diacronema lutheri]|uniref:Calcineurin-like phosphoesterase domain-containing protein n=2 Tax=Diacronema lutheri TaxID=2081491 RepID=A0A8J5X1F6_DIALT|nr:hypothetical protein KFE25_005168 [Diacronema lutheri]